MGIRELMLPSKMTIYSETLRKKLMKMFRGKQNRRQTEFSSENLIVLVFCVFLRRNRKKSSIKGQKKSFFSTQPKATRGNVFDVKERRDR